MSTSARPSQYEANQFYGFNAVSATATPPTSSLPPQSISPRFLFSPPSTPLTTRINDYANTHLPSETYNHSRRVYTYGLLIASAHFPDWHIDAETWFLACMLHDIGTTYEAVHATKLSFEFWGGIKALKVLQDELAGEARASQEQAESVAEAIIRHQDIVEKGSITTIGRLLQLATIFDNTGNPKDLLHPETVREVIEEYPRPNWSSCFVAAVKREMQVKPWGHTSALGTEDFIAAVEKNKLMDGGK